MTPPPRPDTRERILETARALFNERGYTSTSTNHIAAELGISPGNLYYHFPNKQAIARELWQRMSDRWGSLWATLRPSRVGFIRMVDLFWDGCGIGWDYRFYLQEQITMLREDPELRRLQLANMADRSQLIGRMMAEAGAAGLFVDTLTPEVGEQINRVEWFITHFWLSFIEIGGEEPSLEAFRGSVRIQLLLMDPYLEPTLRQEMWDYLADLERDAGRPSP